MTGQSQIPKLILHIGDPKTGSTSIQTALRNGFCQHIHQTYTPWKQPNANDVVGALVGKETTEKKRKLIELQKWSLSCTNDYAVLSSEFFESANPKTVRKKLDQVVPELQANARVIAYVRPHASRFLSAYVQRTKTGMIADSTACFLEQFREMKVHQYTFRFRRWRNIFPYQFTLRPFARERLKDNDIVADFFRRLFRDSHFSVHNKVSENATLKIPEMVGLRIAQEKFKTLNVDSHVRSIIGVDIANYFLPQFPTYGSKPFLDIKTVEAIHGFTSDDAKTTDDLFFRNAFLVPEMKKALDEAARKPMDLTAERYFTRSEIKEIHALATSIAASIEPRKELWSIFSRNRRRLYTPSFVEGVQLRINSSALEAIDHDLLRLAERIAQPQSSVRTQ